MKMCEQREFIYGALVVTCALIATPVGLEAAVWTFIQIAVVIELTYWMGKSRLVRATNEDSA